ncbi:MAG TPA: hypothetical protein VNR39_04635 [Pseudolabrys sp.]|nr:hypothetical protein [Pseudolabrys sp.]
MIPPVDPRYMTDKQRAENRARYVSFALWGGAAVALLVAFMLYAYTDQAPPWLRNLAHQIDAAFGYPILALIRAIAT